MGSRFRSRRLVAQETRRVRHPHRQLRSRQMGNSLRRVCRLIGGIGAEHGGVSPSKQPSRAGSTPSRLSLRLAPFRIPIRHASTPQRCRRLAWTLCVATTSKGSIRGRSDSFGCRETARLGLGLTRAEQRALPYNRVPRPRLGSDTHPATGATPLLPGALLQTSPTRTQDPSRPERTRC